jgi:uridine kinase
LSSPVRPEDIRQHSRRRAASPTTSGFADDERLRRRLQRDVVDRGRTEQSVLDQWFRSVQPMFEKHIAPSAGRANLVVDGARDASLLAAKVIEAIGT